ncbi:MAG: dephospho-CoA kinase [Planctomycetes bacterium]|nr:dephospho-CoA kinase [Planctomycetota bacterium]
MTADPPTGTPAPAPFRPASPVVIGIVGGIAAGKSAVAERFALHGLVPVDADRIARATSDLPEVLAEVEAAFGPSAIAGGRLDRPALAARVFADPAARARLEAILHPRIRATIRQELGTARSAGHSVLLDVPLLFENGLYELCDHVVFVDAPEPVRQARARTRGWADGELARREQAQLPLAEKRARSRFVVDNGGGREAMAAQVAAILHQLATLR